MSDIEKITDWYPIEENRCVCCGEVIPEGYQVCAKCEEDVKQHPQKTKRKRWTLFKKK